MDMDAKISPSFWSDPDIENQPPEFKLTFLWLITNRETSKLGLCPFSTRRFAFETGLPPEWLQRACDAHAKGIVCTSGMIFLRNFIAYQLGRGKKLTNNTIFRSLLTEYESLKPDLQSLIAKDYPEIYQVSNPHAIPMPSPCYGVREGEGEGEGIREEKEKSKEDRGVGEGDRTVAVSSNGNGRPQPADWIRMFNEFWTLYPKKKNQADAEHAFNEVKAWIFMDDIRKALEWQTKSQDWNRDCGRYIPAPARYLRDMGWKDQPITIATQPAKQWQQNRGNIPIDYSKGF